jgi:hypothetical protein
MKPYDETVDAVLEASEPIKAEPWDFDRDRRELDLPGHACGVVSVHGNLRNDNGTGFVSLELHALSAEQAVAVLHVLSRKGEPDAG